MTPETARQSPPEAGNEERYRALLQSLSTIVWVADAQGEFKVPQPGWEKYTGHGFDQHKGTGWVSDVHPDDRAHVAEVWNKAVQSRSWYEVGWRCWHGASQSWRQCITRGAPVADQDGMVREWIGAVVDIEDRVDAELKRLQNDLASANRELTANFETVRRLQQLSTQLIKPGELNLLLGEIIETTLDLTGAQKGNIQLLREGVLRIIEQRGFDTAFLDYFNKVEHGKAACGTALDLKERVIVENVATSSIFAGTPALDVMLAANVRAVQSTPLFTRSGQLLGMFSTHYATPQVPTEHDLRVVDLLARQAADVIERFLAEERFRQSEAQFRRLVESNIVGIVIANEQRVLDANDVYLRMLGCSREDLLAGRADWAKATPPESYVKDVEAIRQLREHGACAPYEKEYIRPDGSRVPIIIGVAALEGYDELTWICVVVDVTEQKRLQNEVQSANELSRANRDLEQFAYSASHDLQEPLRSIKIYSEFLTKAYKEKLDGEALAALGFVIQGAARMDQLLRDLLTYAQALRFHPPAESVDAGACLKATLDDLTASISESGAKVHCEALPAVQVHSTELQQLFQNILGNAIKYSKPGVPPVIHVSADRQNGKWRFGVKDNGIGIEPEFQERVFGLFKRLHTQHEYAGTGIGLALCQRIVEHYGGRIWVESEAGAGSTFYFTLPE